MRKIIVLEFITLDGVIQAPGGPDEDKSDNFKFGGWTAPYFDDYLGNVMAKEMNKPFALLLGRLTYQIFASYWPDHADEWPGVNTAAKYVVSSTLKNPTWQGAVVISDHVPEKLQKIKSEDGPDLQVYGSSNLMKTLLSNDLIDEFQLKIFPITLGSGKKLFGKGTMPKAFTLTNSDKSPSGVVIATYNRDGEVRTGSVA